MPYLVKESNTFRKDCKKTPHHAREKLREAIKAILNDPFQVTSVQLKGNWTGFRSYHFGRKPEYRILYRMYINCRAESDDPDTCRNEDWEAHVLMDVPIRDCLGIIDFVRFGTREEMNNIYRMRSAQVALYMRYGYD